MNTVYLNSVSNKNRGRGFGLIERIVTPYLKEKTERTLIIENDSHRKVVIEFFSDPDVSITEVLGTGTRPLISMEIKSGTDASNIHNRLGEAEKSHLKAKQRGFYEFWTITRVEIEQASAQAASPTTSRLFNINRICNQNTADFAQFRDLLSSVMSIHVDKPR